MPLAGFCVGNIRGRHGVDPDEILTNQEKVRRKYRLPTDIKPCIARMLLDSWDLRRGTSSFILATELHRIGQSEADIRRWLESGGVSVSQARHEARNASTGRWTYGCPRLQEEGYCLYRDRSRCPWYQEIPRKNRHHESDFWRYDWPQKFSPGVTVVYLALAQIEQKRNYAAGSRVYVSHKELAGMAHVSRQYIPKALEKLEAAGLLRMKPGKPRGERRGRATEIRRVIPIPKQRLNQPS